MTSTNSITGIVAQNHSYLHIQERPGGLLPGDWKTVWVSDDSENLAFARGVLARYQAGKLRSPLFNGSGAPLEHRLLLVMVMQTVNEIVLPDEEIR